jgi:hypothetical protein
MAYAQDLRPFLAWVAVTIAAATQQAPASRRERRHHHSSADTINSSIYNLSCRRRFPKLTKPEIGLTIELSWPGASRKLQNGRTSRAHDLFSCIRADRHRRNRGESS